MKNKNTAWLVKVSILSAVATLLMLFEFPLPFIAPGFYELDFSEVPVLIGAFAMGPMAGVVIEGMKIVLNLLLNGTDTAFVGELANFVTGVVFILPAAIIYKKHKSRKMAALGLAAGGLTMVILGCFINAYVMIPFYSRFMPISAIIGMAAEIWPVIDTMLEFVIICVAPFNTIKVLLVSLVTLIIYKHISPLLKGKN